MKQAGKKAVLGALALLTAASVTAGSLFENPAALLPEDGAPGIVYNYNVDGGTDDDAGGAENESDETRRRGGVRAALRARILRLPLLVRLLVVVPLWALGTVILAAAGAAWPLLQPALGKLALCALMLLVLAGAFLLAAKAVFPDLPVKKLFRRRSLVILLLGALTLAGADAVLPFVWEDYARVREAAQPAGLFAVLACAVVSFALHEQRRRRQKAETAEKAPQTPKTLVFTDGAGTYEVRVPNA